MTTPTDPVRIARRLVPGMRGRAADLDASGAFPHEDFRSLRSDGLLGMMVPVGLGGLGASFADYIEVAYQLGRGNGAVGLVFNMHACVTGALAAVDGEIAVDLGAGESYPAVRDAILADAAGGSLYAVAMSERGVGARLSEMSTRYESTPTGFRVRGAKAFVSGAGHADAYLVAARSAADGTVSQFIVPASTEGVTVRRTWDVMGMRATGSHDVAFDVDLPSTALLGGAEGLALPLAELAPHWMVASYAAVYVGVARAAVEAAADDVGRRGLARLSNVRSRIGRADAACAAAHATLAEAARRVDAADPEASRWVWRAKLLAGDTAAAVTASMMEVCGASAIRRGHPVERLFRDARCGALQPATSDVCADWLGVAALGGDPYRDNGREQRW